MGYRTRSQRRYRSQRRSRSQQGGKRRSRSQRGGVVLPSNLPQQQGGEFNNWGIHFKT